MTDGPYSQKTKVRRFTEDTVLDIFRHIVSIHLTRTVNNLPKYINAIRRTEVKSNLSLSGSKVYTFLYRT